MRKSTTILICLLLLFLSGKNFAGDVTVLQLFHIVKQVFPETKDIALLMTKEDINKLSWAEARRLANG